jgi:hypothetical protein
MNGVSPRARVGTLEICGFRIYQNAGDERVQVSVGELTPMGS